MNFNFIILFKYMTSKVDHFDCQLKWPPKSFSWNSRLCLNLAHHYHLRFSTYYHKSDIFMSLICYKQNLQSIEMLQRRVVRLFLSRLQMLQPFSTSWVGALSRIGDQLFACAYFQNSSKPVIIQLPPYIVHYMRAPRHFHPLCSRQIHSTADYYKYFNVRN